MIDPETEYLMARAKEEAVLAIQARHPDAAAAHQELSLRYSVKAVIELVEGEEATNPDCGESPEPVAKL